MGEIVMEDCVHLLKRFSSLGRQHELKLEAQAHRITRLTLFLVRRTTPRSLKGGRTRQRR